MGRSIASTLTVPRTLTRSDLDDPTDLNVRSDLDDPPDLT